ncbi:hypothetical protein ACP275_14G202400 [Erythranthe tilingii]
MRDQFHLIQFLQALQPTYEATRASLLSRNPLPTLDLDLQQLNSEEIRLSTMSAIPTMVGTDIVAAVQPPRSPITYYSCHKTGHIAYKCPNQVPDSPKYSSVKCNYCHAIGHTIDKCRKRQRVNSRQPHQPNTSSVVVVTEGSSSVSPVSEPSISLSEFQNLISQLKSGNYSSALSETAGTSNWLFDSGCCNHMTYDSNCLSYHTTPTPAPIIHTTDGSCIHVNNIGHVSTPSLTLPHTYYIPNLTLNLIYVGQLCDLGFELHFYLSGCVVQDPKTGKTIGIGHKRGRMFEFVSLHLPSGYLSSQDAATTSLTGSLSPFELWHHRLGHVSSSVLT